MRGRLGGIAALIILTLFSLGSWWAANRTQQSLLTDPPRRFTHEPDSYARNFFYVSSNESGLPILRLEGTLIKHYPDDDSIEITNAIAFSQRENQPLTIGRSKHAVVDQDGARITLFEDAVFKRLGEDNMPPLTVQSHLIILHPDDEIAISPNFTTIMNGDSKITGVNMHYNNSDRTLKVASQVRAIIAPRSQN